MNNKIEDVAIVPITYKQLRENNWTKEMDDRLGIASFIDDNIRKVFLTSPRNIHDEKTALLLAVNNGTIVGRHLLYGTSIMVGENKIIEAQSFGSIEVHISQRGKGVGTLINKYSLYNTEYPFFICSLLSHSCLSIMKKESQCTIFDFPIYTYIINPSFIFAHKGVNLSLSKFVGKIGAAILKITHIHHKIRLSKLKKIYRLQNETIVPNWVSDICINDGHKYAEVHDAAWFQWNLDNNLSGNINETQSFISICKDGVPVGFVFIKERLDDDKESHFRYGTICEWGSKDDNLTESDINLLALTMFSNDCCSIKTVTNNHSTEKKLRHYGFMRNGRMQMGFIDKLHQFSDINDESLWRIRFGCCNSILI